MKTIKNILNKTVMNAKASRGVSWYKSADLRIREAIAIATVTFCFFAFLYMRPVGAQIETSVQHPAEFKLRSKLKKEPVISPRIKVFALDDNVTAKLNATDFSLKDWANIIEKLDKLSPKAIFVDKLFGLPMGLEDHKSFSNRISAMGAPIVAAVYWREDELKNSEEILLRKRPEYSILSSMLSDTKDLRQIDWLKIDGGHFYGPHPAIRDSFRHLGQINYDSNGFVKPFYRTDREYAVPHLALFASDLIQLDKAGLFLDDQLVPLDRFGRIPINLTNVNAKSFRHLVHSSPEVIADQAGVRPDDFILIIPNFYTGNADIWDTPAGKMPGGFIIASMINSVITKNWIRPARHGIVWLFVSVLIGALCVFYLQARMFWIVEIFVNIAIMWVGLIAFTYFNVQVPWLFSILCFSTCSLVLFAKRSWVSEEKSLKLRDAFEGNIPPEHLDKVLNSPTQLALEARSEILTIMSIDLVGFSDFYETSPPHQTFQVLRSIFQDFASIAHRHGGIADKTHDKGFIFYFGYDLFGQGAEKKDHADSALDCAFEIMKAYVDKQMKIYEEHKSIPYPVRIGINTASVFIGDLGGQRKIDFSIIGYGISDAKKLERLCNDYMIIISSNTKNFLTRSHNRLRVNRRISGKKQLKENLEAFEYDAFLEVPSVKQQAINNFRKLVNLERLSPRQYLPESLRLEVRTGEGVARLVDFSHRGLGILGYFYAAKGETITVELIFNGKKFFDSVDNVKVGQLKCRVMWSYPDKNLYRHGLEVINLTDELANLLEQTLARVANTANRLRKSS